MADTLYPRHVVGGFTLNKTTLLDPLFGIQRQVLYVSTGDLWNHLVETLAQKSA